MSTRLKRVRLVLVCLSSAALLSSPLPLSGQIVINEIHYNPDVKTEPVEFVELYNTGSTNVALAGWSFAGGINYTFANGASIAPDGYLVIAGNPAAVQSKFGVNALGPWTGTLANEGEKVELKDGTGATRDVVNYQLGFPWPTVGASPGYSIELVNPMFDNDLGGNWRASILGNPSQQSRTLILDHSIWKYFKGQSEASSPTTAWRLSGFDDSTWAQGMGPIGYDPILRLSTVLSDMQFNYTTVFFRKTFVVTNTAEIGWLTVGAQYDDGFKVWINGVNVLNANIAAGELPFDGTGGTAREDATYNIFNLAPRSDLLVAGTNIIALQAANSSLTDSSDFFLDVWLAAQVGTSNRGPTPGSRNSVYDTNAPPQIRQVDHSPSQPIPGEAVSVTAKITDPEGVGSVSLQYQLVNPGSYIELTDVAYTNNWTIAAMNDAGQNGDALAGDGVYTITLPAAVQIHRRLIRYRIKATDGTGLSVTVPYADDPQPNFAYFVYAGVPAWQGALRPGATAVVDFDTNVMRRLPSIHLIAKSSVVADATWFSRYGGDLYQWAGTLVYDGKVYDHIHYRARGGVWRYAMVKNMWKFDMNRGHDFEMRDDYGKKYKTKWSKLNLGASIQQGDYGHRGEQGMFESVGFRLFNLAGVESPNTTFLQFRVIDDAAEAPVSSQYDSDFWGVYLAIEQEDGRFLDEHELPDGNLYKMEGGSGELNNLGPLGPDDKSDLNAFKSIYQDTTPSDDWWRTNMDLPRYYSYQAIVQGIHHYDIADGKNYFFYHNPGSGRWSTVTWDLDLTWANNMYRSGSTGGDEPFKSRVLDDFAEPGARPALSTEFRNRVRELRDLLFNSDQAFQLINEHAWLLRGPTNGPTILDADRFMWDYNPKMADSAYSSSLGKAGQGRFYQWPNEPSVSKSFDGCIQLMRNYVNSRGAYLDTISSDAAIPSRPTAAYVGPANFPLNRLMFQASAYSGGSGFAAMKWRIAEVTDSAAPAYDPAGRRSYEVNADWESAEQTGFDADITIPSSAVKIGHAYRVRVRMKDSGGRWSNWSQPVQFVVGEADQAAALVDNLKVTEVMYDPAGGSEFEFVELHNVSTNLTLDLDGVNFTAGIDLTFGTGMTVPPGGYLLVVNTTNHTLFRAHYGLSPAVLIVGPFGGSLANDGEQLELKTGAGGSNIVSFSYGGRGWPVAADGADHSLVPLFPAMGGQATGALDYPGNWRASTYLGGSPGAPDPDLPAAGVVLNEIAAHTDYADPGRPEYDSNDWLELHNPTASNVSLAAWYLSDDTANLRKWALPAVTLVAGGRMSFDEVSGFHNPITTGFGLDKAGEQVLLSYLPGTSEDRVVDAIRFKGQENDYSLGRYPDGGPFWQTMLRTRDAANAAPVPGIVIDEIMYHPPDLGGTNDNTVDEYVELRNATLNPINLHSTNGSWRLDGGVGFTFPAGTTISGSGILLVVNFDPADGAALNAFRARHGLTNPGVAILGPYSGKLKNRSDRVALERPQYPDLPGDPYSWVILDEVIYGNQSPWPATANGGGDSLQRVSFSQSGNDPQNWIAAAPTPGSAVTGPGDADSDGIPDTWEDAHGLDPRDPADASLDPDGDGLTNRQEYLAGTDPQDGESRLDLDALPGAGGQVTLQFTAQPGRSYTLLRASSSGGNPWQKLLDVPSPQSAGVIQYSLDSGANTQQFFQVVTPQLP